MLSQEPPAELPPAHHPVTKRAMHVSFARASTLDDVMLKSSGSSLRCCRLLSLCKVQATMARPNSCLLLGSPANLESLGLKQICREGQCRLCSSRGCKAARGFGGLRLCMFNCSGGNFSLGLAGAEEPPGLASPGRSAMETSMAIKGCSASQLAALVRGPSPGHASVSSSAGSSPAANLNRHAKAAADSVACHV